MSNTEPKQSSELNPSTWLEEYGDYLFRFAMARVMRREVAEDLVQETLLAAYRARDSFEGRAKVKTWLTEILKNKIIDHRRKASRTSDREVGVEDGHELDTYFNRLGIWNRMLSDWGRNPEEQLSSSEFFKVFRNCLGKLPEKSRSIFTMKLFDHLETEDICNEVGISTSNFWVMQHRTRHALRECLEKNWAQAS